jgi:hypothetical protein
MINHGDSRSEHHQHCLNLNLCPTDQGADNKKKGTIEAESSKNVLANTADPEKKLKIGTNLSSK